MEAPTDVPYFPAAQATQAEAALTPEYLPCGQVAHVPSPWYPYTNVTYTCTYTYTYAYTYTYTHK